jgi:hypothetical protein
MAAVEKPTVAAGPDTTLPEVVSEPGATMALSRFEFETGKGNEGTKILMVEWDASIAEVSDATEAQGHDWDVSWDGKTPVLPIWDLDAEPAGRRVYYLLPPGAQIPTVVSISRAQADGKVLQTKPLPAIFPKELAGGRDAAGERGVLHTIWAKKRLAELQKEIEGEMKANGESVGLEMAAQERQWIVDHFGLTSSVDGQPRPGSARLHILLPQQPSPDSPISPRSPLGGRLAEKLRGLKLATSPTELAAAAQGKFLSCQAFHRAFWTSLSSELTTSSSQECTNRHPLLGIP